MGTVMTIIPPSLRKLYNTNYGSAMGYTPVAFIICNNHVAQGQDDYSTGLAI